MRCASPTAHRLLLGVYPYMLIARRGVGGRHIEDYKAALDHVRRTKLGERVDASRIALWGTSFAGGHVLRVAAEDRPPTHVGSIRAVVSQVVRRNRREWRGC